MVVPGVSMSAFLWQSHLECLGVRPTHNKTSQSVAFRYRFGIAELLGAIGELPQSKSPWVVLKRIQRTWW